MSYPSPKVEVKEEEDQAEPVLYRFSPEASPGQWNPNFTFEVPRRPDLSPPAYSQVPVSNTLRQSDKTSPPPLLSPFMQTPAPQYIQMLPDAASTPKPAQARIPRPPNAFMLFRSDFLRRNVVPSHVERRQQNLSCIAGQCWRMMSAEDKAKWHQKAAEALAEHKIKHPNYKFTPAARGTRGTKNKAREEDGESGTSDDRIRQIREDYVKLIGPAPPSSRKRRPKKAKSVDAADRPTASSPSSSTQTVGPSRHYPRLNTPMTPQSHPEAFTTPPPFQSTYALTSFRLQGIPHASLPRRPSTSQGFNEQRRPMAFGENDGPLAGSSRAFTPPPPPAPAGYLSFLYDRGAELVNALLPSTLSRSDSNSQDSDVQIWDMPHGDFIDPDLMVTSPSSPDMGAPATPPYNIYPSTPAAVFHPAPIESSWQANNSFISPMGNINELCYMKPAYDTPLWATPSPSLDPRERPWTLHLPDATELEDWNFAPQDYADDNVSGMAFSVGNIDDSK